MQRDPATAVERVFSHDHRPVTSVDAIGQTDEATVSSNGAAPRAKLKDADVSAANLGPASALSAEQFGAAIAQKLRERRAQGLAEVQRD